MQACFFYEKENLYDNAENKNVVLKCQEEL